MSRNMTISDRETETVQSADSTRPNGGRFQRGNRGAVVCILRIVEPPLFRSVVLGGDRHKSGHIVADPSGSRPRSGCAWAGFRRRGGGR